MRKLKTSSRAENALMEGVGKALDSKLTDIGHAAVREIVTQGNHLSVNPKHLPYVFWALANNAGLPRLGQKEQKAFDLMISIMARTGTMPPYQGSFQPGSDDATDSAIDATATYMGRWAMRTMFPALLTAYKAALTSQVRDVPRATNGQVSQAKAFDFLRFAFRSTVDISSSMFRDGELLRRVVRVLPI
jgi:hypothetical protein